MDSIAREFIIPNLKLVVFIFVSNIPVSTVLAGATEKSLSFPGPTISGFKARRTHLVNGRPVLRQIHAGGSIQS